MHKRYVAAYSAWLLGVLAMAAAALAWYRYVEEIGWSDVANRLRERDEELAGSDA